MTWKDTRSHISNFIINSVDYVISIDETGIPSLKNVNAESPDYLRWFTITGCIFKKDDINNIADSIISLKRKHWSDASYHNHRVYLHSRDIRRRQGPFHLPKDEYSNFRKELNTVIGEMPVTLCSATIDKFDHITRYLYPRPVYQLALSFMIERITMFLSQMNATGVIILECRGWREDNELLTQIVNVLNTGTSFISAIDLKRIKGVYFERKLTQNGLKSYWPFEISDIICYRINKYAITGVESDNFLTIKKNIMGYPNHIIGRGIKKFPR
ncbi:hypothetical protein LBR_09835 [Levilactobacillus brevis]|uniref:DUF3800 domain-containing protein n=1 Tax=Levilactobacillus brevis TaxID=1580 RepID=UPI000A10E0FB|nr:DUF3800 domain-containing protein [Levilactobacillus brevis]MCT3566529.1 DUF3800 domain-containing protein [Levilactobacillus brevis]ORJ54214.1 hypothetical protein LBR_09835 [Levilactobacillus brevis]